MTEGIEVAVHEVVATGDGVAPHGDDAPTPHGHTMPRRQPVRPDEQQKDGVDQAAARDPDEMPSVADTRGGWSARRTSSHPIGSAGRDGHQNR